MNKRERILLITTVIIVGVGGILYFLPEDLLKSLRGGNGGGDLNTVRQTFTNYGTILKRAPKIRDEYQEIAFGQSSNPEAGQTPSEEFSNELYNLLTERFGIAGPDIDKARLSSIEDVPEYYFVEIPLHVKGELPDMIRLLINMEGIGVLIKSFDLAQAPSRQEEIQVNLDVEVARLIKHDEQSRELFKRLGLR